MLEAVIDVLTEPQFLMGVLGGFVVLAVGIAARVGLSDDEVWPYAGLLVAGASAVILVYSGLLTGAQVLGLALLTAVGFLNIGVVLGSVLSIPGAFLIIRPDAMEAPSWMSWFAFAAIVLAAPLVAAFDERYGATGLSLPLLGISTLGVFLTVPDTEGALVILGVAGIAGFLGWPRPFASLGRAGSYAVIGVFVLVAAAGSTARPAAIIGSVALLGLLVIVPIAIRLRGVGWAHHLDRVDPLFPLVAQLLLVLLISRTAGRMPGIEPAAALTIGLLAVAATLVLRRPSHLSE
jgi:hypothetical protein